MDAYGNGTLTSTRGIVAVAKGDAAAGADTATAFGVKAITHGGDSVQVDNADAISAAAYGATSQATALSLDSYGGVTLGSTGSITAKAAGDDATASGIEAVAHGASVQVDNGGKIAAEADGASGTATALLMDAYGSIALTNGQTITASGTASATGVEATSSHDDGMRIDNAGTIAVTSDGTATALSTSSYGGLTLTNGKTITASGGDSATGVRAVSSHGDVMKIDNADTIAAVANGAGGIATALSTGAYGNITLTNGGAITASS
jgi:hypothetical protein